MTSRLEPSQIRVRFWSAVFGIWGLFLTGIFTQIVGSPGIVQAVRLQSLLGSDEEKARKLEADISRLDAERTALESNSSLQAKEIRRILGYVADDEIVFDFSSATTPKN